jgi:threonylcarbamoyladenosine tRNA methylthiotransferase MtaB
MKEIKNVLKSGIEEIVLSGIHLGLYGKDFKTKDESLVSLLKNILSLKGNFRLRLSSIEITEVSDELIDLMSENEKMCRHLHIPLQSGNDKILKLMNRPYDTNYFIQRIEKIREKMPDMAISTDVIVGFPGEKDSDFKATYEFCKLIKFSKIHVFSFSAHEKTAAYNFPDKVQPAVIAARSARLRELSRQLEGIYKKKIMAKAKTLEFVLESSQPGRYKGKTEFFFDVIFTPDQIIAPQISAKSSNLLGKIIKIRI